MVQNVLTLNDWERIKGDYFGRTVTHTPRTKTVDGYSGAESFTNGTPASVEGIALRQTQSWTFDEKGKIEGGDAYCMVDHDSDLKKDDLVAFDDETYIVRNLIEVPGVFNVSGAPTMIYWYANLFVYDGDDN